MMKFIISFLSLYILIINAHANEFSKSGAPITGKCWKEPKTGMEFVWVPKGCFMMGSHSGSTDEGPIHKVCLDGFWIGKYEVTVRQWKKIIKEELVFDTIGDFPEERTPWREHAKKRPKFNSGDNYPIVGVSWKHAKGFISKLNQEHQVKFRLPTEAQWEYAARSGGKDEKYAGGSNINDFAWYLSNSKYKTHPVGTKAPNGLDIFDMSGNVSEWCEDRYDRHAYLKYVSKNPVMLFHGSTRVYRGGNWSTSAENTRVTKRDYNGYVFYDGRIGFRVCFSPPLQK
ncbi:MAG: formylglycine-generating enzyme family protein [Desulfobacterales bacterium]|nr:formylglycine-generating enzyme family protein [Desulfobacterales bacterium]